MRSTFMPRMKPAPPKICTASEAQNAMVRVAWFFIMQISATGLSPWVSRHASISSIACEAGDALRHVDQLVADHLMLRDRLAESLALPGVGNRVLDADAGIGSAACRHAHALAV